MYTSFIKYCQPIIKGTEITFLKRNNSVYCPGRVQKKSVSYFLCVYCK